jgi:hypothetical protein
MKKQKVSEYKEPTGKTPSQITGSLGSQPIPRARIESAQSRLLTRTTVTQTQVGIRTPDRGFQVGRQVDNLGPKTLAERAASCGGSVLPFQKNF